MFLTILAIAIILSAGFSTTYGKIPDDVCNFFKTVNCTTFKPRIICASDGTTFDNDCEFVKRRCVDESLHILIDGQVCPTNPPKPPSTTAPPSWCRMLLAQNCEKYKPRILCGSDGNTYPTACHFSQAHCLNPNLTVTYDGKGCFVTDTPTSHPDMTTSSNLLSTVSVVDFDCNITNHLNCDDYASKSICASNGQIYKTECDFAKDHCKDPSLQMMPDGQGCSLTTFETTAAVETQKTQTSLKTTWTQPTPAPDTTVKSVTHTTITEQTTTTTELRSTPNSTVTQTSPIVITETVHTTDDKHTTLKTHTTHTLSTVKPDTTSEKTSTDKTQPPQTVVTDTTLDKTENHSTQTTPTPTTAKPVTTQNVVTQTTAKPDSTPPHVTPTKSTFDFLCRMFMSSDCNDNLNVVCSTNGNYRNTCEYQKAKCIDPSIHRIHDGFCLTGEGYPSNPSPHEIACQAVLKVTCPSDGPVVCDNHGEKYPNFCVLEKTKCLIHGIEIAACSDSD